MLTRTTEVESIVPARSDVLLFPEVERCTSNVDEFTCRNQISINIDNTGSIDLEVV